MTVKVHGLLEFSSEHASPGGQFSFRVLGPCCRLFDREELPWPCCRLAWRSKEPSWRRIDSHGDHPVPPATGSTFARMVV